MSSQMKEHVVAKLKEMFSQCVKIDNRVSFLPNSMQTSRLQVVCICLIFKGIWHPPFNYRVREP